MGAILTSTAPWYKANGKPGCKKDKSPHEHSHTYLVNTQNDLDLAQEYYSQGHMAKAEELCQRILQKQPQQSCALRLLGYIARVAGENSSAINLLSRAIATDPDFADAYHARGQAYLAMGKTENAISDLHKAIALNHEGPDSHFILGNIYTGAGLFDDAATSYLRAITIKPDFALAWYNLGNVQIHLDRNVDAIDSFDNTLKITPDYPEALNNQGAAFKSLGRLTEARDVFEKAVALKPDFTVAHNNLGATRMELGHPEDAVQSFTNVISFDPGYAAAHTNLGNAYATMKQWDKAIASYKQALSIDPDDALGYFNLGIAYQKQGSLDAAISSYQTSTEKDPGLPEAFTNLGILYRVLKQYDEAVESFENAIKAQPDFHLAHSNLGLTLLALGQVDKAVNSFQRALSIFPDDPNAHGNFVYTLQFLPNISGKTLLEEAMKWDALHCAKANTAGYLGTPDPERRLRIGYVSADFKAHAVAVVLESLLMGHNREEVEIFCYSEVGRPDDTTMRFMEHADAWRSTVGVSDEEMDAMIREDAIDIIVECTGHTKRNRRLALSRKPAPIQVNYLPMHGETSGMAAMDYALSDQYLTPPGYEDQFSETLIYLKSGSFTFRPDPAWPDIGPPRGFGEKPTFACVGSPERISDVAIDLWARLLEKVPDACLLLKHPSYGDPRTRAIWRKKFDRLEKWTIFEDVDGGWGQHMDAYGRVDVVLDTYPMTGATSCIIPIWMGVPNVLLAPPFYGHRVGISAVMASGLPEFVANDADEYLEIAARLINDRNHLATLRQTLRGQLEGSPICDVQNHVREIETAYREMWKTWCSQKNQLSHE